MATYVLPAYKSPTGYPRPLLPYTARFSCGECRKPHFLTGAGILDTGADRTIFPSAALMHEHGVTWESLPYAGRRHHTGTDRTIEMRLWPLDVSVFGVRITTSVWVSAPGEAPTEGPVFGLDGLFSRFAVALRWDADPPYWILDSNAPALDMLEVATQPSDRLGIRFHLDEPGLGVSPIQLLEGLEHYGGSQLPSMTRAAPIGAAKSEGPANGVKGHHTEARRRNRAQEGSR